MSLDEDWKLCVDWMVCCQVIKPDDKVCLAESDVFDFAQLLRDGVIICYLLMFLRHDALDLKDFCQQPKNTQHMCLQNIGVFLKTCQIVFHLDELFDPNDLFEMKDFGKVLNTLSQLSLTPLAKLTGIKGFCIKCRSGYHRLQSLASSTGPYDIVYDVPTTDDQTKIYEEICSIKRDVSLKKTQPLTKRDHVIKELVETEGNYLQALQLIVNCFLKNLKEHISKEDCSILFSGVEKLYFIHLKMHNDLVYACQDQSTITSTSVTNITIAECFIKWKDKMVIYGEYCSNLPKVDAVLDRLLLDNNFQMHSKECENEGNASKFRLKDLLSVPMQRVLKYHLLLKELIKHTESNHPERKALDRALEEMKDLSAYINEVKRDNENLKWIDDVEKSIVDLIMPEAVRLRDYGHLMKDGELRIRRHIQKKDRSLMVFLFEKVILICKATKRDRLLSQCYNFKDALSLSQYFVEDHGQNILKDKDRIWFSLVDKKTKEHYNFATNTKEMKDKWVNEIKMAQDNVNPSNANDENHEFILMTFSEPTTCDVCKTLLKGIFFQGYTCLKTRLNVHKSCIDNCKNLSESRINIQKSSIENCKYHLESSIAPFPRKGRLTKTPTKLRAISSYHGLPPPPNYFHFLSFNENDILTLIDNTDENWWMGLKNEEEGYFPKRSVIILNPNKHDDSKRIKSSPMSFRLSNQSNNSNSSNDSKFVGELNREEASKLLESMPNGTFLVRVSNAGQRKGEYALSIRYGYTNPVKHIKIQRNQEGRFYLVDTKIFHTIQDLIVYYQSHSLERSFPEVPIPLGLPYNEAAVDLTNIQSRISLQSC